MGTLITQVCSQSALCWPPLALYSCLPPPFFHTQVELLIVPRHCSCCVYPIKYTFIRLIFIHSLNSVPAQSTQQVFVMPGVRALPHHCDLPSCSHHTVICSSLAFNYHHLQGDQDCDFLNFEPPVPLIVPINIEGLKYLHF